MLPPRRNCTRNEAGKLRLDNGKTFKIYYGQNTIGRNKDAVVNIKDINISHMHAIITVLNDGTTYLSDLKSSNGTYLNYKLQPFVLYSISCNNYMKFGNVKATFLKDIDHENDTILSQEMTQNCTQNFYNANTQILHESQFSKSLNCTENIHEALTQVIAGNPNNINTIENSDLADTEVVISNYNNFEENFDLPKTSQNGNLTAVNDNSDNHIVPLAQVIEENPNNINTIENSDLADTEVVISNDNNLEENIDLPTTSENGNLTAVNDNSVNHTNCKVEIDQQIGVDESSNDSVDLAVDSRPKSENLAEELIESQRDDSSLIIIPDKSVNTENNQLLSDDDDTDIEETPSKDLKIQSNSKLELSLSSDSENIKPVVLNRPNNTIRILSSDTETQIDNPSAETDIVDLTNSLNQQHNATNDIFDDSEIIPATQEDIFFNTESKPNSTASEVSFRLKLSESESRNVSQASVSENFHLQLSDSLGDSEKLLAKVKKFPFKKRNENASQESPSGSKMTFDSPKNNDEEEEEDTCQIVALNKSEDEVLYLQPTQKLPAEEGESIREDNANQTNNEDFYLQPTQNIVSADKDVETSEIVEETILGTQLDPVDADSSRNIIKEDVYMQAIHRDTDSVKSCTESDSLSRSKIEDNNKCEIIIDIPHSEMPENTDTNNDIDNLTNKISTSISDPLDKQIDNDQNNKVNSETIQVHNDLSQKCSESNSLLALLSSNIKDNNEITKQCEIINDNSQSELPVNSNIDNNPKTRTNNDTDNLTNNISIAISDDLDKKIDNKVNSEANKADNDFSQNYNETNSLLALSSSNIKDDNKTTKQCEIITNNSQSELQENSNIDNSPKTGINNDMDNLTNTISTSISDNLDKKIDNKVNSEAIEVDNDLTQNNYENESLLAPKDNNEKIKPCEIINDNPQSELSENTNIDNDLTKNTKNNNKNEQHLTNQNSDTNLMNKIDLTNSKHEVEDQPAVNVESQLEVMFASPKSVSRLPKTDINRPKNPLGCVLNVGSQDLRENDDELENLSSDDDKMKCDKKRLSVDELPTDDLKVKKRKVEQNEDENVTVKNDKSNEDPVMNIRRSSRRKNMNNNVKEVNVENTPIRLRNQRKRALIEDQDSPKVEEVVIDKPLKKTRSLRLRSNQSENNEISNSHRVTRRQQKTTSEDKSNTSDSDSIPPQKVARKAGRPKKNNDLITKTTININGTTENDSLTLEDQNRPSTSKDSINDSSDFNVTTSLINQVSIIEQKSLRTKKKPTANFGDLKLHQSIIRKSFSAVVPDSVNNNSLESTPERSRRKLKPKVAFTMMRDAQLELYVRQMGGLLVDSIEESTVLVTGEVKRTPKLLSAVGLSKPICSPNWILESQKNKSFLDPWDHILIDKAAEKKWNFSLKESLQRSATTKLFKSYSFVLVVNKDITESLKNAIEVCGGKIFSRMPANYLPDKLFIISTQETLNKCKKLRKDHSNVKVIEKEAVFDAVLRQEIRFEKHYL